MEKYAYLLALDIPQAQIIRDAAENVCVTLQLERQKCACASYDVR